MLNFGEALMKDGITRAVNGLEEVLNFAPWRLGASLHARWLAILLSAALYTLAMPPWDLTPLAWVALVPFVHALRGPAAAARRAGRVAVGHGDDLGHRALGAGRPGDVLGAVDLVRRRLRDDRRGDLRWRLRCRFRGVGGVVVAALQRRVACGAAGCAVGGLGSGARAIAHRRPVVAAGLCAGAVAALDSGGRSGWRVPGVVRGGVRECGDCRGPARAWHDSS